MKSIFRESVYKGIEPTKKQREVYSNFNSCPCCRRRTGYSTAPFRGIENPGEDLTQVWCDYCSQYMFLEDYLPKNKK